MSGQPAGTVWVHCPNCLSRGAVPASAIGAKVRCRQCAATFLAELERPAATDLLEAELTLAPSDLPPTSGVQAVSPVADEYNLSAEPIPHPLVGTKPPIAPAPPETPPEYLVVPPKDAGLSWAFTSNVFTFPWTLSALLQWLYASLGLAVAGGLGLLTFFVLAVLGPVGPGLMVGTVLLILVGVSYAVTCLVDITINAAYNCDKLQDWPNSVWNERVFNMFRMGYLVVVAAMPAAAIAKLSSEATGVFWPVLTAVIFLLYPILQLAALEADDYFWPISGPVFRSLGQVAAGWLVFYLLSGLLLGGCAWLTVVMFKVMLLSTPLAAGPLWAAAIFIYGRLLGRLAWLILQRGNTPKAKRPTRDDALLRGLP